MAVRAYVVAAAFFVIGITPASLAQEGGASAPLVPPVEATPADLLAADKPSGRSEPDSSISAEADTDTPATLTQAQPDAPPAAPSEYTVQPTDSSDVVASGYSEEEGQQLVALLLLTPLLIAALVIAACVAIANHAWRKYDYRVYWNGLNLLVALGWVLGWMIVSSYGWASYVLVVPLILWAVPFWNAVRRTTWTMGILIWLAQLIGVPLVVFSLLMIRGSMNERRHA